MSQNPYPFQPGAMLHDAIMGALRAKGVSFGGWCRENNLDPGNTKCTTCGVNNGIKSQRKLRQLIEYAGPEAVRFHYEARLKEHYQSYFGDAA